MPDRDRPVGEKRILTFGALLVAIVLGIFAALIHRDAVGARDDLDTRFHTRAELTATFARQFLDDLAAREARQAESLLAEPEVAQADFDQVVAAFEFDAAVLLDAEGRVLQVHPPSPDLIGRTLTEEYEHLRAGVAGEVGVSRAVPSAVERITIAAVAAPYETASGRRVLSGAFEPDTTPLGDYVRSVVPIAGGTAFLVDDRGSLLTLGANQLPQQASIRSVTDAIGQVDVDGEEITVATDPVEGTPWRVVLVAPSAALHAPVDGGTWFAWVLWVALALLGVAVVQLALRLNRARGRAATAARTDELTGLPNRRAMQEVLASLGGGSGAGLLIVDVDHFKRVNDEHGHPAGDEALRVIAGVLRDAIRSGGDVAGRWGGEEFLVVLRPTTGAGPAEVAERIRVAVAAAPMPFGRCTASIGVATLTGSDVEEALRAADAALYRAKEAGRDRVVAVT